MSIEGAPGAAELLAEYLTAIPDLGAIEGLLHPDVSFTLHAPTGGTRTGRARILSGLRREFQTFYHLPTFDLQIQDVFGDRSRAVARFTISAETVRGPYFNHYAIVAIFSEGLLIEAWEYVDSASARIQLNFAP